jgi:hypothetical protein
MTVIMDSDEYEKKIMILLRDDAYSVAYSDQTKQIESESEKLYESAILRITENSQIWMSYETDCGLQRVTVL